MIGAQVLGAGKRTQAQVSDQRVPRPRKGVGVGNAGRRRRVVAD